MTIRSDVPAFPKPKDKPIACADFRGGKPSGESGVKVMSDGREICNQYTTTGRKAYRKRIEIAWTRQKGRCCLEGHCPECPGQLYLQEVTLEHESGRGMGGSRRDDRMELDGRWHNGAAHLVCNSWKSSRRIDYNSALQRGLKPVVPERKP
jgi:hypothetical protein